MEFLNGIFEFLFSRERTAISKIGYIFMYIIPLILAELHTGFFTTFLNGQKVDQIEKIETVLANKSIDNSTREYLKTMEKEIIQRGFLSSTDFQGIRSAFFSLIEDAMKSTELKKIQDNNTTTISPSIISDRWVYWHTISSAWMLIIMSITVPIRIIFKEKLTFSKFYILLFTESIIVAGIFMYSYFFSFIPILGSPWVNLGLNAVLHFISIIFLAFLVATVIPKLPVRS